MSICVDSFAPEKQGMAALNPAATAGWIMGGSAKENPARQRALEELAALRKDLFHEEDFSSSPFPPAVIEWKSVESSMGDNGVPPSITASRPLLGRSFSLSDVDSKRAAAAAAAYKDKEESVCNNSSVSSSSSSRGATRRAKTFPPPLGSLARKSYSHCPNQVPWVLLQPIRSKNRIVLQEVKIANQMSFQPIRKEGRLVLNLIRHGDENSCGRPIAKSSPKTTTDDGAQEQAIESSVLAEAKSVAEKADAAPAAAAAVAKEVKEAEQGPRALAVPEEGIAGLKPQPAFCQASASSDDDDDEKNRHAAAAAAVAAGCSSSGGGSSGGVVAKLSSDHGLLENAGRKFGPRMNHIKGMFNPGDYLQHQCRCSNKREDDHHRPTIWEQHHFHCVTTSS